MNLKEKRSRSEWKSPENNSNTFPTWRAKSQLLGPGVHDTGFPGPELRSIQLQKPGFSTRTWDRTTNSQWLEASEAVTHSHQTKGVAHTEKGRQTALPCDSPTLSLCSSATTSGQQAHNYLLAQLPEVTCSQSCYSRNLRTTQNSNTLSLYPAQGCEKQPIDKKSKNIKPPPS